MPLDLVCLVSVTHERKAIGDTNTAGRLGRRRLEIFMGHVDNSSSSCNVWLVATEILMLLFGDGR